MEQKNSYEVFVYKSPSVHLIEAHARVLSEVLLNGVAVKESMSSLVVNPESGYFTFNFTPPQKNSYAPQEEPEARKQLDRIMSLLATNTKNYVRTGLLPDELAELFTANYFRNTTLIPLVDPVYGSQVQKWSAQFVVELDAIENRSDRTKNKALLNEGFSLVFGNDAILEMHYQHLPLKRSGREKLIAAENSQGEQKKGIYYARNRDNTVLPFFISDKGLLPASGASVVLSRNTQNADSVAQQFPQEQRPGFFESGPVAFEPGMGHEQNVLQAMEFDYDMDCTGFAFRIAFISYCTRLRAAVWRFNVDMDVKARHDSLGVKLLKFVTGELINEMVTPFGLIGSLGLTLFSEVRADIDATRESRTEITLEQLNRIWIGNIDRLLDDIAAQRQMYQNFLKRRGYRPDVNEADRNKIFSELQKIAKAGIGIEGLPGEVDLRKLLIQAYVNQGKNGTPGYIRYYLTRVMSTPNSSEPYEVSVFAVDKTKGPPAFENLERLSNVHRMVKDLWPGVPIINLPFDLDITIYDYDIGLLRYTRRSKKWYRDGVSNATVTSTGTAWEVSGHDNRFNTMHEITTNLIVVE